MGAADCVAAEGQRGDVGQLARLPEDDRGGRGAEAHAAGESDAAEQRMIADDDASLNPVGNVGGDDDAIVAAAEHVVAQYGDAGPRGGVGEVGRTRSLAVASGLREVGRGRKASGRQQSAKN